MRWLRIRFSLFLVASCMRFYWPPSLMLHSMLTTPWRTALPFRNIVSVYHSRERHPYGHSTKEIKRSEQQSAARRFFGSRLREFRRTGRSSDCTLRPCHPQLVVREQSQVSGRSCDPSCRLAFWDI